MKTLQATGRPPRSCVAEPLEGRVLLSAADVLASLRPLRDATDHADRHHASAYHIEASHAGVAGEPEGSAHAVGPAVGATPKKPKPAKPAKPSKGGSTVTPTTPTAPTTPSSSVSDEAQPATTAPTSDLTGTWQGTLTVNASRETSAATITLTTRHHDTFTGNFDLSSVAGEDAVSSVTVLKNRAFNVIIKLQNKTQISIAAVVTSDYRSIIGRWSVERSSGWFTGTMSLKRV